MYHNADISQRLMITSMSKNDEGTCNLSSSASSSWGRQVWSPRWKSESLWTEMILKDTLLNSWTCFGKYMDNLKEIILKSTFLMDVKHWSKKTPMIQPDNPALVRERSCSDFWFRPKDIVLTNRQCLMNHDELWWIQNWFLMNSELLIHKCLSPTI